MPLDGEKRASIIEQIMKRKFGNLLDWKRVQVVHNFGPNDAEIVDEFEIELAEIIDLVQNSLGRIADDGLEMADSQLSNPMWIGESRWGALYADRISRAHCAVPPEISYGFGHPKLAANFEHWARMPRLSLHEVSLLTLGADPKCLDEDRWVKLDKSSENGKPLFAAFQAFLDQRQIFSRCYHFTGFGYAKEPIGNIKRWIDDLDISVHPDFYAGLDARLRASVSKTPEPEIAVKPMTSQERDTLLKLIAAMACEQYGYDPRPDRSAVPSSVREDLERVGIAMDDKTIRKWLKEASHLVAPEYWESE